MKAKAIKLNQTEVKIEENGKVRTEVQTHIGESDVVLKNGAVFWPWEDGGDQVVSKQQLNAILKHVEKLAVLPPIPKDPQIAIDYEDTRVEFDLKHRWVLVGCTRLTFDEARAIAKAAQAK
jgi:hypothetical protein